MTEGARQNAPSTGEWRAIQGYEPQYALAAELALEVAAAGRLKSVRLIDPNAHIADDFQIVTDERVDAYQVKWSGKPSALTFRQFGELFADLAQSLRQLREEHGAAKVIIHLATNGLFSTSDRVNNDSGTSIGPFHDFHREVILTAADHKGVETTDLSKWSAPLQELAKRAGLGEADTLDVLAHLHVDTGLKLADEGSAAVGRSPSPQELADIQSVKAYLLRRVRKSSGKGVVEIPASELLSGSGLGNRLELRNTHHFPSPDIEYRPLAVARDQLAVFLKSGESGYVALVGPPGSGKSTLISEEFADPELRILRYYAFLPGTGLGQGERGEAEHFFYDMNLSFRLVGSAAGSGFPRSRSELRAEFLQHLADASAGFQRNGRRTVLFIDGIDHVPREQNPGRSFLNDLPLPAEIPSGVIIALGTQTTNLSDLPRQVRYELEVRARRIDISPLSEQQVREIASAEFPEETDSPWALSSRLFELSEGHPLSLAILIRRAKSSSDTPLGALSDLSAFRADIDEYYRSIWDCAEPDDELFDFLGMACRDRRPINVRAVEKQHRRETLLRFRQHFGHVWQLDASGHLHVFHNSFRLFLLDRTACDAFSRYDESRHIEFHRKLAERYRNDQDPIRQWETIYHFDKAGQREDALQLVTPVAVRRQLECFRLPSLLGADLRVALQLAFELQDIPKAAEIALVWNELNLNDYAIADQYGRLAQELLNAGRYDQAISLMTDGRTITLTPAVCMKAAVELARAGRDSSARELFLAAEPLAALHSLDNSDQQKQIKDLETWANLAVKFRRPEQVLHLIQSAQLQGLHHPYDNGGPELLRNRLLIELAVGLQESTTGSNVVNEIDEQLLQSGRAIWLELQRRRIRTLDHQNERCERLAQQVVDEFRESEVKSLTVWDRLSVSEIALLDADQPTIARRMTEGLSPPQAGGHVRYDELSATHWYWFRLARVGALLGEPVDLDQVLPLRDVADRSLVKRLTTRHIAKLGHLAGQLRRNVASVPETLRDIRLIFRFLAQRDGTYFSDDSYREARSLRPAIIDLVVNKVANAKVREEIVELIIEILSDDTDSQNWAIRERVAGLEHLIEAIAPSDACRSILQRIQSAWADDDSDASSRIDRSLTLASLWNQLGDRETAITHLTSVIPQPGVVNHDDDDQINVWCGILSDANRLDSDEPAKRRRLESMVHTVLAASEMRARSYRAAEIALRDVTQSNAAEGLQLVSLFSDTGVLSFADAVGAFLVGVLRSSPDCGPLVAAVASEILLPLGEPQTDLIDALATASGGVRELLRLAGNVDVLSLEENRWDWHRKIVDAASKHEFAIPSLSQAAADEHKPVRSETNPVVEVGIDEKVPVDELCQQIQTPEDFRQFRATARDRSWIDTKPLTRELCRRWDADFVARLATIIQQHDRTGHEILVCAEQLENLGVCPGTRWLAG